MSSNPCRDLLKNANSSITSVDLKKYLEDSKDDFKKELQDRKDDAQKKLDKLEPLLNLADIELEVPKVTARDFFDFAMSYVCYRDKYDEVKEEQDNNGFPKHPSDPEEPPFSDGREVNWEALKKASDELDPALSGATKTIIHRYRDKKQKRDSLKKQVDQATKERDEAEAGLEDQEDLESYTWD